MYMFKVNNRNTGTRCEIFFKVNNSSSVYIVNFEQVNVDWVTGIGVIDNFLILPFD